MRLLVLFDLPTGNSEERKSYSQFRKFLLKDGYIMEQYSVYTRVVLSRDAAETHVKRLRANLPLAGSVTVITLTERQYESRQILVNTVHARSQIDVGSQLTLIL